MSVKSMTGYARVRRALPDGEMIVTLKSVNHRGLDLHFHMPGELDPHEGALRTALKKEVSRGHVQVHVSYSRERDVGASLNTNLFRSWAAAFAQAKEAYGIDSRPDLNSALRLPGMLRFDVEPEFDEKIQAELIAATEEALRLLNGFRAREGEAIAEEIHSRSHAICELVAEMENIRSRATPAFQKRLRDRLADLLHGVALDPQRLAQEAAVLADRSDIAEELVRLKTHAAQVDHLIRAEGDTGKKLDFLLQEMNREANTILSKTGGLGEMGLTITELALAAKSEIDKIREQSLNLE